MNITKNDATWTKYTKGQLSADVAYKISNILVAAWIDEVDARLGYADIMGHLINIEGCRFQLRQEKTQMHQWIVEAFL